MTNRSIWSVLLAITLGACTTQDDSKLQIFRSSYRQEIKSLDPALAYESASLQVVSDIFETLYQYDYLSQEYQVIPLLAADMPKVSTDRKTVTIPIRRGIRFQDDPAFQETGGRGREITAHDFIYALKRLALPALHSPGWWILDGKVAGINAFREKLASITRDQLPLHFAGSVEGLRAPSKYTLEIKLTKPYPQLLYVLTLPFTAPVAKEVVDTYGDERGAVSENPVGTGPFKLDDWDRRDQVILVKNPSFRPEFYPTIGDLRYRQRGLVSDAGKLLPFLDRIEMNYIPSHEAAWSEFLDGEIDVISLVKAGSLSSDLATRGITSVSETSATFYYLSFNMEDEVIGKRGAKSKALRQAISSAIDREKWIQIFSNGRGEKATSVLPPGIPNRPKKTRLKYDYNISRAKRLLGKAGYPGGRGLKELTLDMRGSDDLNRRIGEFFSESLKKIGIKLKVRYNRFSDFLKKAKDGKFQIAYGGWAMDYPDAQNVYQLFYGKLRSVGLNESKFTHSKFNKLYEEMAELYSTGAEGKLRENLIRQMENIIQEEVPWALGFYHSDFRLSQPWLRNFRPAEMIINKHKYYKIDLRTRARYRPKN